MTFTNGVREGRLTASGLNPAMTTIVYGLDASHGTLSVALDRYDPAPGNGQCAQARAQAPAGSTGTTYFVFDALPGSYVTTTPLEGGEHLAFIAPAGKQVYVGDFAVAPEKKWSPPFDFDVSDRRIALSRNIDAARAALGPDATKLELAEITPPGKAPAVGFVCSP